VHPTIEGHWWIDKRAGQPVISHCVRLLFAATAMTYCADPTADIPLMELRPALPDDLACPACLTAINPPGGNR
jgi:hypothetical protein